MLVLEKGSQQLLPGWDFRNLPGPNSGGNPCHTMNSEACLGGEIAAVPLTSVRAGMLNTVPASLSCKNFPSPSALPGCFLEICRNFPAV